MILLIRSDTSKVQLRLINSSKEVASKEWDAGRELSEQLLSEINYISNSVEKNIEDIDGIIVYEGPGSYTGLRISISVANTIGYSYNIPVVGSTGDEWVADGVAKLKNTEGFSPVYPNYGGEVYTTKPKK